MTARKSPAERAVEAEAKAKIAAAKKRDADIARALRKDARIGNIDRRIAGLEKLRTQAEKLQDWPELRRVNLAIAAENATRADRVSEILGAAGGAP